MQRRALKDAGMIRAGASMALLAAGIAFGGCESGQDGANARPLRRTPSAMVGPRASAEPRAEATAKKSAAAPQASQQAPTAKASAAKLAPKEWLLEAAKSKEWEIRERLNASGEDGITLIATVQVGASGQSVTVVGVTARKSGGTPSDVSGILVLEASGVEFPASESGRRTTVSATIPGQ